MQKPINRILSPIDNSEPARHAAWIALAIARSMESSLTLLHIHMQERARRLSVSVDADKVPSLTDDIYAALLTNIVGDASVQSLNAIFNDGVANDTPCSTTPADEITEFAGQQKTDLIVMGADVHSGLHDMLMGSVATDVLENATCSVTVVH